MPHTSRTRRTTIFVIVVLLGILFSVPVTRTGIMRMFASIGMPFVRGTHVVTAELDTTGTVALHTKRSLIEENTNLKSQVAELTARLLERDMLARQLAELKADMGRMETNTFTLASIIAKPPHSPYGTLIIDGGESASIATGSIVYANGRTPIGVVDHVLPTSAVVRLYAYPGQKTQARLTPANLDVELVGRGGGNFVVVVPHNLVVDPSSVVVTTDINPHVVATMQKVISDPRDPLQTILFSAPVNVLELSFVQVKQ